MPEQTPNHALQEYSIGETGWTHTPDLQTVDERLPIAFDERANRSNYTPFQGAIFWAMDTGEIFRGDGVAWLDETLDVSQLLMGGNLVATQQWVQNEYTPSSGDSMQVHDNEWHSVDFATLGDLDAHTTKQINVHGTDDSGVASISDIDAAIDQHLLDADHSGGGGVTQTEMETHVDSEISTHANLTDVHHAKYTDAEAVTAVDGSSASVAHATDADTATNADNATFWDGYELVIGTETPQTDQYIRLEEGSQ